MYTMYIYLNVEHPWIYASSIVKIKNVYIMVTKRNKIQKIQYIKLNNNNNNKR